MSQVVIGDILPYTQGVAVGGQTVYGTNWTANYASDVVVYSRPAGSLGNDVLYEVPYPAGFSVAFIGDQQEVQVTLVTPSTLGDIVTITRQTPADRENLYTNTNFLPSMLNNDFGILTLVDQQAQLVDQKIGPRYNYSSVIVDVVDTILPILGANEGWVKNPGNTAIIPYVFPSSGIAPAGDTYVTITDETGTLPNSFPLSSAGDGIMVNKTNTGDILSRTITGTSTQITVVNGNGISGNPGILIADNPIIPGTAGMGIPIGSTGQRVIPATNIGLRYNTTNAQLEYWTGTNWAGLTDDGLAHNYIFVGDTSNTATAVPMSGDATIVDTGAVTVSSIGGVPISLAGSFATHGAFGVVFTFTGATGVTFPTSGTLATTDGSVATLTGDSGVATASAGNINILGGATGLTFTGSSATLTLGGTAAISHGGTGVTSVTIAPTASAFAGWDANRNISADNHIEGYTTTATAASTTVLTVDSTYLQFFTGVTTQTVTMPVTSTLVLGQQFEVTNNSSGIVTVQSSGANTIQAMASGTSLVLTCIATSGTTAASWSASYVFSGGGSGTVNAGLINELAWYAAAGTTVSGLTTANDGVLITSAAGVPSISSTLPSAVQNNITVLGAQAEALDMNTHLINNVVDPVSAQDAATKNYVDTLITGGGLPVVAASTVAFTATYSNGTAGVGATLTNATTQAAFSLDGITPSVGQRVLIKNQASTLQNGVYTVTDAGSGATNWVLTRAVDYNTPTDINSTGVIPVISGTVNGNTGWINTTIMVTVGTTAITFVQFGTNLSGLSALSYLLMGG